MTVGSATSRAEGRRAALAIDIGGTKAEAAIVATDGSLVAGSRVRAETGPRTTAHGLQSAVQSLVRACLAALPPGIRLIGAGIGSAGPLDRAARTVSPVNMPAAAGTPVAQIVEAALGERIGSLPAVLALDGTALALAEHWLTPGHPPQSLLGIVVSTGVGGGLVMDGLPVTGTTGNAGQIGQSYASGYGTVTTLEEIASGPASVRYARALGWSGQTGEDLARSAAEQDTAAITAIDRSAHAVGNSVASLAAVVDFERVVIAGGFSRVIPDYATRVARRLQHHPFAHVRAITIEAATRPLDGPLIGAAALAFTAGESAAHQNARMLD